MIDRVPVRVGQSEEICLVYEQEIARRVQRQYGIAFAFARTALVSILHAMNIRLGDEVILSPLTCKVVPLALLSIGVKPLYGDIPEGGLNLSAASAASLVSPRTRLILFQHTYGHDDGILDIVDLAERRGIGLIEDCAHCLPLSGKERMPGQWGEAAIFSNNPGKPLPADSGGVAVLDDEALSSAAYQWRRDLPARSALAEKMRKLNGWAHNTILSPSSYWLLFDLSRHLTSSYRSRPLQDEIASAVKNQAFRISRDQGSAGLNWLAQTEEVAEHRRRCCAVYSEELKELPPSYLPCPQTEYPLYYFPVLVPQKDKLLRVARRRRLPLVPWPTRTPIYPVEKASQLKSYGYHPGSCPAAEDVAQRLVGLPTAPYMEPEHCHRLTELIRSHVYNSHRLRS